MTRTAMGCRSAAAAALLCLGMAAGCTHTEHYTVLSTKDVELTRFTADPSAQPRPVTFVDDRPSVLGFPLAYLKHADGTGIVADNNEAIDRALETGQATVLTDATVKDSYLWLLLYDDLKIEVTGNAPAAPPAGR